MKEVFMSVTHATTNKNEERQSERSDALSLSKQALTLRKNFIFRGD